MKRILNYASIAVGLWVLGSFAGTMIDKGNSELWTQSLMVSLIASLLVLPAALILAVRDSNQKEAEAKQEFDSDKFAKEAFGEEGPQKKEAPATVALNVDDIEKHAEEMKKKNGNSSSDASSDKDTLWPDDEEEPQNA